MHGFVYPFDTNSEGHPAEEQRCEKAIFLSDNLIDECHPKAPIIANTVSLV